MNKLKMRRRSLIELPEEIQLHVLTKLPVRSICRVRSVCKALLEVIDSPEFISMHSGSLISTNNTFAEEPPFITFFVSYCVETESKSLQPDTMSEILSISESMTSCYMPCFCFHNLLCFKNTSRISRGLCFLLDPFREEVLTLPDSEINHVTMFGEAHFKWDDYYGMGFDNTNNTYKIIRISSISRRGAGFDGRCAVALLHVLGTSLWREIPQSPFPSCLGQFLQEIGRICAYGDVHWIFCNRKTHVKYIRSFDFTKEEFYFTPHPPTSCSHDYYLTLKGRMAVISVGLGIDVWVMNDYTSKEWTLEYHLNIPQEHWHNALDSFINCGEWDQGIVFVSQFNVFYFVNLRVRSDTDARITSFIPSDISRYFDHHTFNLRRTLISFEQFGNSVQDPKSGGSTYYKLLDFSRKYLWNEGTKPRTGRKSSFLCFNASPAKY